MDKQKTEDDLKPIVVWGRSAGVKRGVTIAKSERKRRAKRAKISKASRKANRS